MELTSFYDKVESDGDLQGVGVDNTDRGHGVIVKHIPTSMSIRLPVEAVKNADWDTLHDVMVGNREPSVLQHMTRIVGYYSKIENWNPSKLGELKDRQSGNYEI